MVYYAAVAYYERERWFLQISEDRFSTRNPVEVTASGRLYQRRVDGVRREWNKSVMRKKFSRESHVVLAFPRIGFVIPIIRKSAVGPYTSLP